MLQVELDKNNWVINYSYNISRIAPGYIVVNEPEDLNTFFTNYDKFKLEDDTLIFYDNHISNIQIEKQKKEIRHRRETECFSIIDRSQLWYNTLSQVQLNELNNWYQAWLVAPDTLVIPTKPDWL